MLAEKLLMYNLLVYGLGGIIAPFIGIKIIDIEKDGIVERPSFYIITKGIMIRSGQMQTDDSASRSLALKNELVRVVEELKKAGAKRIILFGSLAKGDIGQASDIDLLVVRETKKRFIERLVELYELIDPKFALDLLVYTPSEFDEMKKKSIFVKQILREGKLLYEA